MLEKTPHFTGLAASFSLFVSHDRPAWRHPQLGALGALAAHWSLPQPGPALVSLPTGTGKTAVAIAAAHLANCRRVLVVVPSRELRNQMAAAFRSEEVLIRMGALSREHDPLVVEVSRRVERWVDLEEADVVVALPHSISPVHYEDEPPPQDLFDLIIVDEAHHAPAPTWRAILNHFSGARSVLLTATPRRRDGQQLPGNHIYHYPLRQALEEGIFKTVDARILPPCQENDRRALDAQIADEVVRVLTDPLHATSAVLVRAANRERAVELASLYESRDIPMRVLHSGLGRTTQQAIIDALKSGQQRGVAVVGMLIEGFDLPRLRIVAYHDKHKSLPATAQLIGRLARVDARFPQPSVVVTVRDVDVFPELNGIVRELYEEDADWATILPGIIDDEIMDNIADHEYAQTFAPAPPYLSIESIRPLCRSIILEIPPDSHVLRSFADGVLPAELQQGQLLRGNSILYADLNRDTNTLLIVTTAVKRPKWHDAPGLDTSGYELHLVSYRQPSRAQLPSLLFVNTGNGMVRRELLRILVIDKVAQPADPTCLHEAFESLDWISVSSLGVRNTYAGRGSPSYRSFAGSGLNRGLREADTAFGAFGHAMVQVADLGSTYTAGVSTRKGKYWETRYVPLRSYDMFVTGLAERYWFPPTSQSGQMLPQVSRGKRLTAWPTVESLVVEFDSALIGMGWHVQDVGPLETLDLRSPIRSSGVASDTLPLELIALYEQGEPVIWRGCLDLAGNVSTIGPELMVQRGFAVPTALADLLSDRPPTVFFVDGTTVHGATIFESRAGIRALPSNLLLDRDWLGVDITAETKRTATRHGVGKSIHEALEEYLQARLRRAKHRWIVCNDGSGELADYMVIEVERGRVFVDLLHAKGAHGPSAAVRVTDMEEVVAQAIKSRRWITEVGFWQELGARLNGRSKPRATIVAGSFRLLEVLCGEIPRWERQALSRTRPIVSGQVVIVQPGLSRRDLERELAQLRPSQQALQTRDLLAVFHDSVSPVATITVLCGR